MSVIISAKNTPGSARPNGDIQTARGDPPVPARSRHCLNCGLALRGVNAQHRWEISMDQSDQDLDQLNALLHALPADNMPMTLSELDGYIVGVLACPEMIPPSEWLPQVWGETGKAEFPDEQSAEETIGAVMARYNSVVASITGSLWIEPIYEVDPNSDEVMWEPWVDGFTRAMRLRPDAWSRLLDQADEETRATMIFLMALQDIYTGQSKFTDEEIDEIDLEAPDLSLTASPRYSISLAPSFHFEIPNISPACRSRRVPGQVGTIHAPVGRGSNTRNAAAYTDRDRPSFLRPKAAAHCSSRCRGAARRTRRWPRPRTQTMRDLADFRRSEANV